MMKNIKHDIRHRLNKYRFSIYLFTQLMILFGSLFIPYEIFDNMVSPILVVVNLLAGLFIIPLKSHFRKIFYLLFAILIADIFLDVIGHQFDKPAIFVRLFSYFVIYNIITYYLIVQIWRAMEIDAAMIMGLISGYISLGLIGFFIVYAIFLVEPAAYSGVVVENLSEHQTVGSQMMYFSFITLLTIGYGDIVPVLPTAQKASMVIGLLGQLYLVIITSITVGKYINQFNIKFNSKR